MSIKTPLRCARLLTPAMSFIPLLLSTSPQPHFSLLINIGLVSMLVQYLRRHRFLRIKFLDDLLIFDIALQQGADAQDGVFPDI